uniref:Uncharacterized protein n=1 Tax=Sipha flava TaxID=143950 RepID=A0A2S2QXT1_9HEMI
MVNNNYKRYSANRNATHVSIGRDIMCPVGGSSAINDFEINRSCTTGWADVRSGSMARQSGRYATDRDRDGDGGGEGVMKKTRVRRRREHEVPSERTRRTIARGPTENIYYNDVNDDILYSSNAHVLVSDCRAGWRSWSSAAEPFADADGVTLGT